MPLHAPIASFVVTRARDRFVGAAAALLLLVVPAQAQAPLDVRVALVIGNSAYPGAPLVNPVNDAKAMSEVLKGMGFVVVEARDASRAEMQAAVTRLRESLGGRHGVGMLYYAGHGLQLDWHNYMVPVDAKLTAAADVARQTVDVQSVLDVFKSAGNRMSIVVLDACRDNPFASSASAKGLAPMDAPPGTFLAYATAPGNVAEDGDATSVNGLYTQYLVREIARPGARIEDVFKRVRFEVREHSQGRQIPWESTSLEDDFFFGSGIKAFVRLGGREREQAFNQQKADWDRIARSKDAADYYAFLKKYPNGDIAELAQASLERVQAARIAAQPDRGEDGSEDFARRSRDGDRYEFVIKDGMTGLVRNTASVVVRVIDDDLVEGVGTGMSGAVGTRAGFIVRDNFGSYDPPWATVPGGQLQVGKKWTARTIQTRPDGERQWVDVESNVVARERLTVPFGTLDVYRVEVQMQFQTGGRAKYTFWYDPGWSYALKMMREFRGPAGLEIFVREMTSRTRGS